MSQHELRQEKVCLNCGNHVEQKFCGNCGQENIEPRQTFGKLIGHFIEDFTHYEGKFWPTMQFLFFKPSFLTKEYLAGKRNHYLQPVRLYIFVSFIAFLLPGLIPSTPEEVEVKERAMVSLDSLESVNKGNKDLGYSSNSGLLIPSDYERKSQLDSAKTAYATTDSAIGYWEYRYHKRAIELNKHYNTRELWEQFGSALGHNFPKALFLYMPIFALVLGLFHSRKKWLFFDHGIFTLHFFSFILLTFLVFSLLGHLSSWLAYLAPFLGFLKWVIMLALFGAIGWVFVYLYIAHHRLYGESRGISILKTTGILLLNVVLFLALLIALVVITFFTLH